MKLWIAIIAAIRQRKVLLLVIGVSLFLAGAGTALYVREKGYENRPVSWKILGGARRFLAQPRERIIAQLDIKPGMDILDLGAGTGYFSFALADKMKGKGRVFAADTDKERITYLKWLARRNNCGNVFPVLVSSSADDPFYRDQSFDIIFVSGMSCYIDDRVDYFSRLRRSLKPGGRVVIIDCDVKAGLYLGNFNHFGFLLWNIQKEGKRFPVFQRLDRDLQEYITRKDFSGTIGAYQQAVTAKKLDSLPDDTPEKYKHKLLDSFNAIIADKTFFRDIDRYYVAMTEEDKNDSIVLRLKWHHLILWFEYQLQDSGVFDKRDGDMTSFERNSVAMLNLLILQQMFRDEINSVYFTAPRHLPTFHGTIREMQRAGYECTRSHDIVPLLFILEFRARSS